MSEIVAPKPTEARPVITATWALKGVRAQRVEKLKGPDKKFVKDADGKIVTKVTDTTIVVPAATPEAAVATESWKAFKDAMDEFFVAGSAIKDLFKSWVENRNISAWFEDLTEAALKTDSVTGKQTVDPVRYNDAAYNGVPRSVNTINSVTAALNKEKVQFSDYSLAVTESNNDQALLAKIVSETFGLPSVAAFGIRMVDTRTKIKALSFQLKELQMAKAERDEEKAKKAIAAPAAPVK